MHAGTQARLTAKPKLTQLYWKWPWSISTRAGFSSIAARIANCCRRVRPNTSAQANADVK
jgi:hypothetical protein